MTASVGERGTEEVRTAVGTGTSEGDVGAPSIAAPNLPTSGGGGIVMSSVSIAANDVGEGGRTAAWDISVGDVVAGLATPPATTGGGAISPGPSSRGVTGGGDVGAGRSVGTGTSVGDVGGSMAEPIGPD